jgi:type VI secretion system secreted protein Hcp
VKNATVASVTAWEPARGSDQTTAKEGPVSFTVPFRACVVAALAALTMLLAIPLSAHAAQDVFLKLNQPDLQGESFDKSLPGAINLKSFAWSIENPTSIGSASGGAGAGKAKLNELEVTKLVDASSPGLMMAAAKGTSIPSATLIVRKAGATSPDAYLQYRLKTVFVTDVETSADASDDGVTETVKLAYGSMQERYVQTRPNGATLSPIITGWDQILNQPVDTGWTPGA